MSEYVAPYLTVRAQRFDGSRESAAALAAAFPGRIAWSVEREGVLLAFAAKTLGEARLHEVEPGSWMVEVDRYLGVFALMRDDHFHAVYSAAPRRSTS